jgi:hypothetical protein
MLVTDSDIRLWFYLFRDRTQPCDAAWSELLPLLFEFHELGLGSSLWSGSLQRRCHRVSQRQSCSDYNYSEGDELDQIIRPFSVGVSITEEARGSNAQRIGGFHVYRTPFTNEMTICMR